MTKGHCFNTIEDFDCVEFIGRLSGYVPLAAKKINEFGNFFLIVKLEKKMYDKIFLLMSSAV